MINAVYVDFLRRSLSGWSSPSIRHIHNSYIRPPHQVRSNHHFQNAVYDDVPQELERLEVAFDHVKKQLFGRLHDIARKQLFPDGVRPGSPPPASLPPASGDASSGSSSGGAASSSNGHGQALSGRGAGEQHNGSSGSGSSGRRALTAGGQLAAGASDGVVIDVDFTQETSRVTAN